MEKEELEEAKEEIEKLKCKLDYKECILQQLSTSTNEKIKKLEDENKMLLLSIDEANEEGIEKQVKLDASVNEVESLKGAVSVLQNKRTEAEKEAKSPKNGVWEGGDMVQELEDRYRKVEEELKWKVEQFKHLEEAHQKLRDQLKASRVEWESERETLVDEISTLQEGLEKGVRAADGFKHQLSMCRQVLESEESKRQRLEKRVEEMQVLVERAAAPNESWDRKVEMECSTAQNGGEEEVVNLRHSLRVKEMEFKDVEYNAKKLWKENQELLSSIKELQEANIPRGAPTPSSWEKLRGKLRNMEQRHKESSANYQAKEAEWKSQAEKMAQELHRCTSSLQVKEKTIEELKKEVEDCNSSLTQLKMQNEELSLMLQLMKSEFSESGTDQGGKDKEGVLAHFMEQLEKEREEKLDMCKEVEKYKDLAEEAADRENQLREELEEVYEALDNLDSELTDKTNEGGELEFKLQSWKSIAGRLRMQLEESQKMRKDLEECLLAQAEVEEMLNLDIEEKGRKITNLEQQILLMDQEIRIGEEDDDASDDETMGTEMEVEDDDGLHINLLARDLEYAILDHITEERRKQHSQDNMGAESIMVQEFDDDTFADNTSAAKENVIQHNCASIKIGESFIEKRSPFRELN